MADPVWPSTLRLTGAAGVSGGPQPNVASFQPEVGTSIDRRRSSVTSRRYDVEMNSIPKDQYMEFRKFVEETLFDGVLPFLWVNPMTDLPCRVKISKKDQLYKETRATGDLYNIAFQIETLDG